MYYNYMYVSIYFQIWHIQTCAMNKSLLLSKGWQSLWRNGCKFFCTEYVAGIVQCSSNTWAGMDPKELVYDAASNTWAGMDPEELVYDAASITWAGMDP